MTFDSPQDDAWLERQLRDVPLPPGLIERLKRTAAASDDEFDAALRAIAIPRGLIDRVRAIAIDEPFDERLRDVPLPAGLLGNLHGIVVESGQGAGGRGQFQRRWRLVEWVVAASLMLAAGAAYLGGAAYFFVAAHRGEFSPPLALESQAEFEFSFAAIEPGVDIALEFPVAVEPFPEALTAVPIESPSDVLDVALPPRGEVAKLADVFAPSGQGVDPLLDLFLIEHAISASPIIDAPLPELEFVTRQKRRGLLPPIHKNFDLASMIRDNVQPFIALGGDAELATSRVPLVTSTASYDRLWRLLGEGRLPDPADVFPEEFLAAVNYDFPRPENGRLAIRAAAGPAPFSPRDERGPLQLLQVGIQTNESTPRVRHVRQLTFAVDTSSSIARQGRLDSVLRGIGRLIDGLGSRDRFSIVTFSEDAHVLAENLGREDRDEAWRILSSIRSESATNLVAGLRLASDLALDAQLDERVDRRIVLFTDTAEELPADVFAQLLEMTADASGHGARLDVVDVAPGARADVRLAELARRGGGTLHRADDAEAVHFSLLEILTEDEQWVAREARLSVKFNPQAVEAYRLIGHEPTSTAGWIGGDGLADLRTGQTATGLYQVRLLPTAVDPVATAELTWRDPVTGEEKHLVQAIHRVQFAATVLESPLSLQRAALAAELAEILRNSPYAPSNRMSLARLLEQAERLHPRTFADPSVRRLRGAIALAQSIRSGRTTPTADAFDLRGEE